MTDSMKQRIVEDMKVAMRAKDQSSLASIRMLRAAIQRRELDSRQALDDAGVMRVIEKMIKQGKDAASQFSSGGRPDLEQKELEMVSMLEQYLPTQMTDTELQSAIDNIFNAIQVSSLRDMGKIMAALKPVIAGKADMATVSKLVKNRLNQPASNL